MKTIITDNKLEGLFGKLTEQQKNFLSDMSLFPRDFEREKRGNKLEAFPSSHNRDLHDEVLDIFLDKYNRDENELTEEFDKYLKTYFGLNDDNA